MRRYVMLPEYLAGVIQNLKAGFGGIIPVKLDARAAKIISANNLLVNRSQKADNMERDFGKLSLKISGHEMENRLQSGV